MATIDHRDDGNYSEEKFWQKLKRFALACGREVVEKALLLYYAAERPETPKWAKRVIYGALAYFILPFDMVADFLPGGYVDDLGMLAAALGLVALYVNDDVKQQAEQTLTRWFGSNTLQGFRKAKDERIEIEVPPSSSQ